MIDKTDIKVAIMKSGKKSQDIADKLGLCKQNFSSLISKQKFTQQDLERIANAIGVRYMSAFVDENDNIIVGGTTNDE